MKKIFTLLVTMCIALCSYADELTFSYTIEDNAVTAIPSNDDQLYLFAPISLLEVYEFSKALGRDIDTPEELFEVARVLYKDNLFTGKKTLACNSGLYNLVLCGAALDEDGKVIATTPITTDVIFVTGKPNIDEDPNADPLSFTFELDDEGFTITPSDDEREYLVYAFTPEMLQKLPTMNMDVEGYMRLFVSYGGAYGHTWFGKTHLTVDYFADEGEEIFDGLYRVAVMGVKPDGNRHVITSRIYQYEWPIYHGEEGIHDILTSLGSSHIYNPGKVLKDGKIIINGRVNLNGTLVR